MGQTGRHSTLSPKESPLGVPAQVSKALTAEAVVGSVSLGKLCPILVLPKPSV